LELISPQNRAFYPCALHFAPKNCASPLSSARHGWRLFFCPIVFKTRHLVMEILGKISLVLHVIAGASTLFTGPLAIFYNFKDPRRHRLVGKTFFYAMLVTAISSIGGYLKRPDQVFYQFLLGLAVLVLVGIFRGVRSIFLMKGGAVRRFDWAYTIALAFNGLWMLGMAAWHFRQGTMVAFPILFGVFGSMSLADVRQNWRVFRQPAALHRFDWMRFHAQTMIGAFIASTTAFTVNAAHFLPWWVQWFGPTLLLLPVQFYFGKKLRRMREQAMG
jgi:FtsH-binding integral membrane protein